MVIKNKRDCYTFNLKNGKKVVYKGVTSNPNQRVSALKKSGKKFSSMQITSPKLTRNSAVSRKNSSLIGYVSRVGRKPKYNC